LRYRFAFERHLHEIGDIFAAQSKIGQIVGSKHDVELVDYLDYH
jgi:hypothetical protein